jgi:hypothetical protein
MLPAWDFTGVRTTTLLEYGEVSMAVVQVIVVALVGFVVVPNEWRGNWIRFLGTGRLQSGKHRSVEILNNCEF